MVITNAIISFYCICNTCCGNSQPLSNRLTASGTKPQQGLTVATGKREIKLGSTFIWQNHSYRIEDRMHKRYDRTNIYHFDIFLNSHQQALKRGRLFNQTVNINIK